MNAPRTKIHNPRFLAAGVFAAGIGFANAAMAVPVINEFSANHTGVDDHEYIEIYGAPNTDYSAYTLLQIEGDGGVVGAAGVIDSVTSVGVTDANGLWLVNLAPNTLENGTMTLLLVKDFTGASGTDLDTNDDGVFDTISWSAIVDSVAVSDGGIGDVTYSPAVLTAGYDGLPFVPGGASRIIDGVDTDSASDWVRNDFDLAGIEGFVGSLVAGEVANTPGALNSPLTVPEPASFWLVGLGLFGVAFRRRAQKIVR